MAEELSGDDVREAPDQGQVASRRLLAEVRHGVRLALVRPRTHVAHNVYLRSHNTRITLGLH